MNAKNQDALDFYEAQAFQDINISMMLKAVPHLDKLREEPRVIKLIDRLDCMETHTE